MKVYGKLIIGGAAAFALLQFVRPGIPSPPATAEIQAPPEVRQVLGKDCYSCHSNERRLAWFDQVVPAYWLVREDVLTAREHLNFSTLGAKPAAIQKATLYEAVNMMQLGAMPLPRFLALHPEAKVTPQDLATLKAYLAPWTPAPEQPGRATPTGTLPAAVSGGEMQLLALTSVAPEFNGFPFDPEFETWKPISFTDRGDNDTFRFILGNDIAVRAVRSGNISPWADGARFAKIAWQQQPGPDGLIHPGKFVQVELMLKDANRYQHTDGWGWGRWRGLDLKPYGQDARFVTECTSCHLPVRGNDYVYTLPITAAHVNGEEIVNNAAALPARLPYRPLEWTAITMYVDPANHTMSTLYGNETALRSLNLRSTDAAPAPSYTQGAVLALATWTQRDDPHWFGARIPDARQSIEFVQVGLESGKNSYRRFAGAELAPTTVETTTEAARMKFILGLTPVRLP
jgi:mono/diheme cytochrome c family protein